MRNQLSVLLAGVLLVACAAPSGTGDYPRTASADDRWGVGVSFPVYSSLNGCDEDPSVESAVQSADMPTSRLGFRLKAGASEADALRVADCVVAALSSGDLTVISPGV
jgi:hypothetical protein